MQKKLLDAIYLKNKKNNNKPLEIQQKATPYETCFGDRVLQNCEEIKNSECKGLNYVRQQDRTIYDTIEVGLELPSSTGQLVRFIPRFVTVITYQG